MLRNNIMYISHMTQLFKTLNSSIISQYFTCYCNKIRAIYAYLSATRIRNVTFVQRLIVLTFNSIQFHAVRSIFYLKYKLIDQLFI